MQIIVDIANVIGESVLAGHEAKLDAIALYDAVRSAVGTSGSARHSEVVLVRDVDRASPKLCESCARGFALGDATISIFANVDTGQVVVSRFVLRNTYVKRYTRSTLDTKGMAFGPQLGFGNHDVPTWRGLATPLDTPGGDARAGARALAFPLALYTAQADGYADREIEHVWLSATTVEWNDERDGGTRVAWDISRGVEAAM